MATQASKQLT